MLGEAHKRKEEQCHTTLAINECSPYADSLTGRGVLCKEKPPAASGGGGGGGGGEGRERYTLTPQWWGGGLLDENCGLSGALLRHGGTLTVEPGP